MKVRAVRCAPCEPRDRRPRLLTLLPLLAGLAALGAGAPPPDVPAFPGAEGFGAGAKGGRGGKVLFVTTLEDYMPGHDEPVPGSLRAACAAEGPRIVVFRVAGTIELEATLDIEEPSITVAGQSAPGGGIALKDRGVSIRTHDVVLRYLRIRPGDEPGPAHRARGESFEPDALSIGSGSHDVIVDHCSTSWSIDECLSVSGAGITDVTVQWCLISESLDDSFHHKGPHGKGSLIRCNGDVTFHHNIYAHHVTRSPRPGTYGEGSIRLDFRNNVIYDSTGYSSDDPVRMNYVANAIQRPNGPAFRVGGEATRLYVEGNVLLDERGRPAEAAPRIRGATERHLVDEPFAVAPVTTGPAEEAYEKALASCGAVRPARDAVDRRVIRQIRRGEGGIIDSQAEVGGWAELEPGTPPPDEDGDGLPDAWEREHGLDPRDAGDTTGDLDGDGYIEIEEWLNGTDPRDGA